MFYNDAIQTRKKKKKASVAPAGQESLGLHATMLKVLEDCRQDGPIDLKQPMPYLKLIEPSINSI